MRRKIALTGATAVKALICFALFMAAAGVQAQSRVIDQQWQFSPDPKAQFTATTVDRQAKWRPAKASLSWNAQFDDLRDYAGVGWYRVTITLPPPQPSTRELIHFGAVDYFTEVWINGRRLGEHEGGYTPFTFDLTGKVHAGNNEILVKVFDPPMPPPLAVQMPPNSAPKEVLRPPTAKDNAESPLDKRFDYNEIPHGKQNWYVQTSGPWQPVTLETVPASIRCVGARHTPQQRRCNRRSQAGRQRRRQSASGHALRSLRRDGGPARACRGRNDGTGQDACGQSHAVGRRPP